MRNKLAAMVAIIMLIVPTAGHATLISHTLDITASNFVLIFGGSLPPPVSPLMIDFTVTLDNAGDISPTTTGLTVHSFNLLDAVQFTYNHSSDLLILASVPFVSPPGGCVNLPNTFCIFISNFSTAVPFASLANQTTSSGGVWSAQAISTRVVAEPGTLELVLSIALAAFGFSQRAQHVSRSDRSCKNLERVSSMPLPATSVTVRAMVVCY